MKTIDPTSGQVVAEYREHDAAEIERRLSRTAEAQAAWAESDIGDRAEVLRRVAQSLREDTERHAQLVTTEMGKPISQSRGEVQKCAWVLEHYAATAEADLRPVRGDTDFESWIRFDPLGVVLAIMPWNFPYWQVFRFAAPNLVAGNAALLKHAENTTGCGLAIEELFAKAGLPEGVLSTLVVPVDAVPPIIGDRRVAAVTLTGSARAGSAVAAEAGRHLKKTVLELGGSDPYLVLEDADLDRAVATCAGSRLLNSGQSCIAAKRFIVVDAAREAFEAKLVERFRAVTMGDPREDGVEIGPLARRDLRDEVHRQVEASVAAGARLHHGGAIPDRPGWFYPATVLTGVEPGMAAFDEEIFGPVAAVIAAKDEDEAVTLANRSEYGLGGAVFTADRDRAMRVAARLHTGAVAVDDFVKSDPRLPFGGVKKSGYGRELSTFGLHELVNVKAVTFRPE